MKLVAYKYGLVRCTVCGRIMAGCKWGRTRLHNVQRHLAYGRFVDCNGEAEPYFVVFAAIRDHDGTVYSVPRPGRHHDVIRKMVEAGRPIPITGEQGFILSDGRFAGREESKIVAFKTGQLKQPARFSDKLFSEDVW